MEAKRKREYSSDAFHDHRYITHERRRRRILGPFNLKPEVLM